MRIRPPMRYRPLEATPQDEYAVNKLLDASSQRDMRRTPLRSIVEEREGAVMVGEVLTNGDVDTMWEMVCVGALEHNMPIAHYLNVAEGLRGIAIGEKMLNVLNTIAALNGSKYLEVHIDMSPELSRTLSEISKIPLFNYYAKQGFELGSQLLSLERTVTLDKTTWAENVRYPQATYDKAFNVILRHCIGEGGEEYVQPKLALQTTGNCGIELVLPDGPSSIAAGRLKTFQPLNLTERYSTDPPDWIHGFAQLTMNTPQLGDFEAVKPLAGRSIGAENARDPIWGTYYVRNGWYPDEDITTLAFMPPAPGSCTECSGSDRFPALLAGALALELAGVT